MSATSAPPSRPRRRRQRRRWLVPAAIVVGAVILVGGLWYESQAHAWFASKGGSVTVQVAKGETAASVVDRLATKGVIGSSAAFSLYATFHGWPAVQPGAYTLAKGSTFAEVASTLSTAPNTTTLVVPAGFTLREVVARLATQESPSFVASFRTALHDGSVTSPFQPTGSTSLEGLVAPGAYLIPPTTSARQVVASMVSRFVTMAASVGLTPTSTHLGHDAYAMVTMASIVEKEGYLARNMPKVATVIYNRLSDHMPLQMDSTVLYALHQDGGTVTHAMLQTPSPYNSYLTAGLPPTPICVVSSTALAAVVHPPAGTWLYFTVVDKTGTEAFSTTFSEQLANEKLAAERGL